MPKPPLLGEVASSKAKMSERLYRAAPALFRSLERRPLSNLSVSLPLDSSPGRRALGKEVSFSMKLDLRLLKNVTECQSLSLWERCLRSRRRGQGCCQRARHTAIRTLLVRAIVSQRRRSNFTGLALSGADAPAPPKWEPLAKRFRFR